MITQPEANVQFTDEEAKRLDILEKRLANLRYEITIYTDNIAILKNDLSSSKKEHEYLTELNQTLKVKVEELTKREESLRSSIGESEAILGEYKKQRDNMDALHAIKSKELTDREVAVKDREAKCQEDRYLVDSQLKNNSQEKELIEKHKETISQAISSVQWK